MIKNAESVETVKYEKYEKCGKYEKAFGREKTKKNLVTERCGKVQQF